MDIATTPQAVMVWLMLLVSLPLQANDHLVAPFSSLETLKGSGWEALEFPGIDRHSRYQLVQEAGQQVVLATSDGGASGLIHRLDLVPGESLTLRWRWKVANVLEQGDARRKAGDDYPARIYIAFEFEPDKAGWFERVKRRTAATLFGEELPGRALNYIWANRLAKGSMLVNAFSEDTVMIAVNSGPEGLGQWQTVERDIVADYRAAFGESPPAVVGIAIMSDADNTGGQVRAWYGDIELSGAGR